MATTVERRRLAEGGELLVGPLRNQYRMGGCGLGPQEEGILITGEVAGVSVHCFVSCRERKDPTRRNTMGGLGAYVAYPPEAAELEAILADIAARPGAYRYCRVAARTMAGDAQGGSHAAD